MTEQSPKKKQQKRTRIGTGRRPRMTEAQTRETALRVTVAAIREQGLNLGLESLSMEDVIREAEVSRTTFYRLWPQKDQFIGDLIIELTKNAISPYNDRSTDTTAELKERLLPRINELLQPETRWRLITDILAQTAVPDFAYMFSRTEQWHTYFALVTIVTNLPHGPIRDTALHEINNSEANYRNRIVQNFEILIEHFGVRLREGTQTTTDVANLMIAMSRGLILHNYTTELPPSTDLFALGAIAMFNHCFEDNPDVVWDAARVEKLRALFTQEPDIFAMEPKNSAE